MIDSMTAPEEKSYHSGVVRNHFMGVRTIPHYRRHTTGWMRWMFSKDVALVLGLLCLSGNPAVTLLSGGAEVSYTVAAALLSGALILRRGKMAIKAFGPVGAVFAVLCTIHAYAFDFFSARTVAGFLMRMFIGMAVVVLASNFVRAYVTAMLGLSALSSVFWAPAYIAARRGIPFYQHFAGIARNLGTQTDSHCSLGFHTYMVRNGDWGRNAGIFWEPGVFAGYLVLSLLMLAALRPSLTRIQHMSAFCVLSAALLSTFSTTGYLALPIAALLNYDWRAANKAQRARVALGICILGPLVLFASANVFANEEFLHSKIERQMMAVDRHQGNWQMNRFGSLSVDWQYISRRPLTGWGRHPTTRYALNPTMAAEFAQMGNGMSDFLAAYGAIGFGTFLLCLIRGAKHIGWRVPGFALGMVMCTLILLQGETYLSLPLFLGLMFLGHCQLGSPVRTDYPTRTLPATLTRRLIPRPMEY